MRLFATFPGILLYILFHQCGCYALFSAQHMNNARGGDTPTRKLAIETSASSDSISKVLIAVDCLCSYHGGYLTARALEIPGVAVVHVLSDYLESYLRSIGAADEEDLMARRMPRTPEEARLFIEAIGSEEADVVAVYCESDSGLNDAEMLRELVGVTCVDDPIVHEPRRNKSLMYEMVEKAGLSVANNRLCSTCEEAVEFMETAAGKRVVVKPFRGVASESVTLCKTKDEIVAAWEKITSSQVFGSAERHSNVLVQEFIEGAEYAVDVVSANGQHKVAAVWRYVKKPVNGASFCYFKTELVDATMDANVVDICKFTIATLDALGVQLGISHNEVILNENNGMSPTLVEVNMRQHNMDFLPLTMSCIGYNIFDMFLLALFCDDEEWSSFPDLPNLRSFGCMVHLVNSKCGTLVANHHIEEMGKLASVFDFEVYEQFRTPGEQIAPTIDIRTDAGWVQLINPDRQVLNSDYSQIEKWMKTMFETST